MMDHQSGIAVIRNGGFQYKPNPDCGGAVTLTGTRLVPHGPIARRSSAADDERKAESRDPGDLPPLG